MKNKLSKGLSLSANPKHLIKGTFSAVQHVFTGFGRKIDIFGNNMHRSNITGGTFMPFSASTINVILRRYSLLEVPWRRIHNVIAKALSICVAVGNKVMDTRLPQPAGCGDKYDVSGLGSRLLRSAHNDEGQSSYDVFNNTPHSALSCHSLPQGAREQGRSMIEMLGVLAIIGVLSVGGIAGYSKAMEQFRINKAISEYSMLIFGMLEHLDDFKKTTTGMTENSEVFTVAESLSLVPQSWNKINNLQYEDSFGNMIQLWILQNYQAAGGATVLTFDFYLGGVTKVSDSQNISANFSAKLCTEIYQKIAIPLHAAAWNANIYKSGGGSLIIDGDRLCDGSEKCLSNISLAEVHSICEACARSSEVCAIAMHF